LLQRLKSGTFYPQGIYNINQKEFNETVEKEAVTEYEIDEDEDEVEEEYD
jgi:hypothetical protein